LQKEQFQRELDNALKKLEKTEGEVPTHKLWSILLANLDRGRVQTFVGEEPARIFGYVCLVVQNFSTLNPYLHQLQTEKRRSAWEPLYKRMQTWAYNYFIRKGFFADNYTREIAIECAGDAATTILKAHFPYDTEFDPWAHTIVQNACRKYIEKSLKKSTIPDEKQIELEDELADSHSPLLEINALQKEMGRELLEALNQLSEARRTVIQSIFFDGLSPEETAKNLNKSVGAIYSLQFNALKDLQKILDTNRDNTNE